MRHVVERIFRAQRDGVHQVEHARLGVGIAAILTVPAKASVQVMSCKQWCEIVYNGKRGWVYKSYVKTGA